MFEDQYAGELSEEQVLFRQILLITGLSTRIYQDTSTDWQVNVRNYVEAINNFEATAIRHLDTDYIRKKKIIITKSRKVLIDYRTQNPRNSNTNLGKEYEIQLTLKYARLVFALLVRTLDDKGVFNEKAYRAIERPTTEEIAYAKGE
jgi:hypothetical protein